MLLHCRRRDGGGGKGRGGGRGVSSWVWVVGSKIKRLARAMIHACRDRGCRVGERVPSLCLARRALPHFLSAPSPITITLQHRFRSTSHPQPHLGWRPHPPFPPPRPRGAPPSKSGQERGQRNAITVTIAAPSHMMFQIVLRQFARTAPQTLAEV